MENIVHLLKALIFICYFGIGLLLAFVSETGMIAEKSKDSLPFHLRFMLIFVWPLVLISYLFRGL